MTWNEAVADWYKKHSRDKRSIAAMNSRLSWLSAQLDNMQLTAITRPFVETLLDDKNVKDSTKNRFVAEISKILHHAHTNGWLDAVPKLRHYQESEGRQSWLTQVQADNLVAALPSTLALMARFTLATGLRESNVRLLQWKNIDMARCTAFVEGRHAKGKKTFGVPLNKDAMAVLEACNGIDTHLVFGNVVRPCRDPQWHATLKTLGMIDFHWHDLRHTWASWHVEAGTPTATLRELGAWASDKMVQRYAHLSTDHLARWAKKIEQNG